jgi:nicotianamine synthase
MDSYTTQKQPTDTTSLLQTYTPPSTPTATTRSARNLFTEIQAIYTTLAALSSLAPGEQVNELLTRLVNLCIVPYSAQATAKLFAMQGIGELCQALRPLCASAEGELEGFWAGRILGVVDEAERAGMGVGVGVYYMPTT